MSAVKNVIFALSFLLLFLNPCVPQRTERENSLDPTGRHGNVNENHGIAENTHADIKRENEGGLASKEETVRFGTADILFTTHKFAHCT